MSEFFSVLPHLNKDLKRRTLEPSACQSSGTDHVIALGSWTDPVTALRSVLQLCVTAQFYLENNENTSSRREGMLTQRCDEKKERERARARSGEKQSPHPGPLAPLFICFFLPLGLPYVNRARQECCLLYLRSSLRPLDLPLFCFCRLFPSLSFSHRHSGPFVLF